MSLQVNEVLIEPETGALSPGMKLDDIRRVYDPTDLLQLYKCRRRGCTPVFERTTDAVKLRALSANWKRAVLAHPRAYLAHRWLAFRGVLRIGDRNPEISGGIARNSLGVPTVRSEAGIWVVNLLRALPRFPFYITWLYALLDCVLLGVGLFDFFKRGNALCFCLSLSGLAYLGTYFLAAGTPDLRYSVWTILTTLLAACALAGLDSPAFAREAGARLAALGGKAPRARRAKRSAWRRLG
jgi:hypothetical protein